MVNAQSTVKRKNYAWLGIWLIIISLLGIPGVWRYRFIELTGFGMIVYAAWPWIIKKVYQKPQIKKGESGKPARLASESVAGREEKIIPEKTETEHITFDVIENKAETEV